jgi:hypothetical protein
VKEKLLCVIARTDRVVHVLVEEGSGELLEERDWDQE